MDAIHDYTMPHDARYPDDVRGCPPNCPARKAAVDKIQAAQESTAERMGIKSLAMMQREIIAVNTEKGWIGNGNVDPTFGEAMALIHSEVSEAFEAWREIGLDERTVGNGKPDDVGSEFADILIRLLHYCEIFGIDLQAEYERKMTFNRTRPYRHGGKAL